MWVSGDATRDRRNLPGDKKLTGRKERKSKENSGVRASLNSDSLFEYFIAFLFISLSLAIYIYIYGEYRKKIKYHTYNMSINQREGGALLISFLIDLKQNKYSLSYIDVNECAVSRYIKRFLATALIILYAIIKNRCWLCQ